MRRYIAAWNCTLRHAPHAPLARLSRGGSLFNSSLGIAKSIFSYYSLALDPPLIRYQGMTENRLEQENEYLRRVKTKVYLKTRVPLTNRLR
jgi:hypothetical protein